MACSASNAEGTSPWLLELKEDHGSDDDDSEDEGSSYKLETEDEDEVEEEYEAEEEEGVEKEHGYFKLNSWLGRAGLALSPYA